MLRSWSHSRQHSRGEEGLTPSPLGSTGEVISSYIRQRAAQPVDFDWWWFQCLVLERVNLGGEGSLQRRRQWCFGRYPPTGLGLHGSPPRAILGGGGCRRAVFNGELPNRASFLLPVG